MREITIQNKGTGGVLLKFLEGRPIFVTLNQWGLKELIKKMLDNDSCRANILDAIVEERFNPDMRDAVIRRLCAKGEDQKILVEELARVGFDPIIKNMVLVDEELVV